MMKGWAAAVAALLSVAMGGASTAGERPRTWPEVKCDRYKRDWSEALTRLGAAGLSRDFLDRHAAFVASGCLARADVCPRTPEEFSLANVMTVRAMNAGTASTFLPFACRKGS